MKIKQGAIQKKDSRCDSRCQSNQNSDHVNDKTRLGFWLLLARKKNAVEG